MARLRCACSISEAHTASSVRSRRPAKAERPWTTRSTRSTGLRSAEPVSECTVMAPALIMGLRGRPVSPSREISLNASPDGSTPTLASTGANPRSASARAWANGLETDWMVNSTSTSTSTSPAP